jgi:hypothetical protein
VKIHVTAAGVDLKTLELITQTRGCRLTYRYPSIRERGMRGIQSSRTGKLLEQIRRSRTAKSTVIMFIHLVFVQTITSRRLASYCSSSVALCVCNPITSTRSRAYNYGVAMIDGSILSGFKRGREKQPASHSLKPPAGGVGRYTIVRSVGR